MTKKITLGIVVLLPIVSAVILGLLFYKLIPAVFIFGAFLPFLFYIDYLKRNGALIYVLLGSFLGGVTYFLIILYTTTTFVWFGFVSSEALFMKGIYGIASVAGGVMWLLFATSSFFVWRRHWSMMFVLPALWVLIEFARRWVSYGITWGFLGHLSENIPMIRQFASVAGTLGIAFVILFFNIALFLILLNLKNKKVVSATTYLLFLMIGIVIILGGVWYGQQTVHPEGRLVAAVLQADSRKSITGLHEEPYATLLEVAKEQSPSLIVMPESIFTDWEGREDNSYRSFMERSFADILGDFDGAVVFGGYRKEGEALYNSFFLLSGGKIITTYDKYYLVPFAEYSPPLFSRFSPRSITMFEKGDPGKTFQTEAYILGPALCQELVYPETTRRAVQNGAEILVSGANDGYVRRSHLLDRILDTQNHWVYEIAHTIARFRAVETGRYLLRSTKVGITSIINPAGKELIQIDSGQPGVGIAEIAVMKGITPYTRFGDFPLLALSFLLAGWGIMRSRNGKNKK